MMRKENANKIANVLLDAWNDKKINGTQDIVVILQAETMTDAQRNRIDAKIEKLEQKMENLKKVKGVL